MREVNWSAGKAEVGLTAMALVGEGVGVLVGLGVEVGVGKGVAVRIGVEVGVGKGVGVGVGDGVGVGGKCWGRQSPGLGLLITRV